MHSSVSFSSYEYMIRLVSSLTLPASPTSGLFLRKSPNYIISSVNVNYTFNSTVFKLFFASVQKCKWFQKVDIRSSNLLNLSYYNDLSVDSIMSSTQTTISSANTVLFLSNACDFYLFFLFYYIHHILQLRVEERW